MQWPYEISADQWAALGAMLGGVAQLALVAVGVLAGNQWLRQKRYDGVKQLIEEFAVIHHEMQQSAARLTQLTEISNGKSWWEMKDAALMEFDMQRVKMLHVAIRCRLYDDVLSANVYKVNDVSNTLRIKYLEYRDIPIGKESCLLSKEEQANNDNKRRELVQIIFVPESELWKEYARVSEACYLRARMLMWEGRRG